MRRILPLLPIFWLGCAPPAVLKQAGDGDLEKVRSYLDNGGGLNVRDKQGRDLLALAIVNKRIDLVKLLLDRGADPKRKDKDGWDALAYSAGNYRMEGNTNEQREVQLKIAKLLIERGADAKTRTKTNKGLIEILTYPSGYAWKDYDPAEFTGLLLAHGAEAGSEEFKNAVSFRFLKTVRTLAAARPGLVTTCAYEERFFCPLSRAVSSRSREMLEVLLELGAANSTVDLEWATESAKNYDRAIFERLKGVRELARLRAEEEKAAPQVEPREKAGDAAAAAGRPAQALADYAEAAAFAPAGTGMEERLRGKAIRTALAMQPQPALPEEAAHHFARAEAFVKRAQDAEGLRGAGAELEATLRLAPWFGRAYMNLALVEDKTGEYDAAIRHLRFYVMADPKADKAAVERKLADLEVARELALKNPK